MFCVIVKDMMPFGQWLVEQIESRGWNFSEFARRCGVTPATISRIVNGDRKPSDELYQMIADVLHVPIDKVFREAGRLPPKSEPSESEERLLHQFKRLDEHDQELAIAFLETLVERREGYVAGRTGAERAAAP